MASKEIDVIDLVLRDHRDPDTKERMGILKEMMLVLDRDDVWTKIEPVLEFLNIHVTKHFKNEEIMIVLMLRDNKLTDVETHVIHEIIEEHKEILGYFNELIAIAKNYNPSDRTLKEKFVEATHNIFEKLLLHAKKEDEVLYPAARKYMTAQKLADLKVCITK